MTLIFPNSKVFINLNKAYGYADYIFTSGEEIPVPKDEPGIAISERDGYIKVQFSRNFTITIEKHGKYHTITSSILYVPKEFVERTFE